ncbi:MAG TPA: SRPBCC family protein [Polyangia bacterium]|nr:SRPBCC family protein [Polyangia bacterium]
MSYANLAIALTGIVSALAQEGFHAVHAEQGVTVYRRESSSAIELGAEGAIDAPPEVVRAVLLDYANHPRWLKGLAESRVLYRGPATLDVYQRLVLPLIDDRDYTLRVTWGADGELQWLRFAAARDQGPPPVEGVVRVTLNEGGWKLYATGGGKATYAVYRFRLDLAGSVPRWMGKGRAGKEVAHLFESIRDQTQYYRWAATH